MTVEGRRKTEEAAAAVEIQVRYNETLLLRADFILKWFLRPQSELCVFSFILESRIGLGYLIETRLWEKRRQILLASLALSLSLSLSLSLAIFHSPFLAHPLSLGPLAITSWAGRTWNAACSISHSLLHPLTFTVPVFFFLFHFSPRSSSCLMFNEATATLYTLHSLLLFLYLLCLLICCGRRKG